MQDIRQRFAIGPKRDLRQDGSGSGLAFIGWGTRGANIMKLAARLILSIAAACLGSFANAQALRSTTDVIVPRLVNFSGVAADENGKALPGVVGVMFGIYKSQNGGSALWLESQNVQADTKGNYTAQLGATKPEGLPLDLFTSGEARWLGVTVNGGQEQARILLLSVPYALKAADAQTLGGLRHQRSCWPRRLPMHRRLRA